MMQAVELNNKYNKTAQLNTTNCHESHNVSHEVTPHVRVSKFGKVSEVGVYDKSSGPTRTVQVMQKSLARHVLNRNCVVTNNDTTEKKARIKRVSMNATLDKAIKRKLAPELPDLAD